MTGTVEFSRLVARRALERTGRLDLTLTATPAEMAALAERFGLDGLSRLVADLSIEADRPGTTWRVDGILRASATQESAVSLEPLPVEIEERFTEFFVASEAAVASASAEIDIDPEEDTVDELPADGLDVGEVVAQNLGLAIDPYLRAPDEKFDRSAESQSVEHTSPSDETHRPFEGLAVLLRGKEPER